MLQKTKEDVHHDQIIVVKKVAVPMKRRNFVASKRTLLKIWKKLNVRQKKRSGMTAQFWSVEFTFRQKRGKFIIFSRKQVLVK